MYKILGYTGGVYRFDEIVEMVEDIGGIVLKRDDFQISRGDYFMSQEIHVIIVIPEETLKDLKIIVKELMGDIEELDVDENQKIGVISLLPIYNALSSALKWTKMETLEEMIDCPCINGICNELNDDSCIKLEKTLNAMCRMEIVENRSIGKDKEYRLKVEKK